MEQDRLYLMKEAPIKTGLLKLGIPSIIGLLMIGFYNFVDSYFVAQLGTHPMGALSVAFPLMTLMPGIGLLFGNGASALISELLGADRTHDAETVLNSTLFYILLFSLSTLLMYPYLEQILVKLGASQDVLPFAMDYTKILIFSFVFHIPSVALTNLVRAEGATTLSAVSQIIGSLINIILDPILMFRFNMGIAGAAIATAIAQFVSFMILITYYFSGKSLLKLDIKKVKFYRWIIMPILHVGLPLFAINFFQSLSMTITNVLAAQYGDHVLASIGIVNRIVTMVILGITGFSRGYQTFASYNYGAKQFDRLEASTKLAYQWTISASIIIGLLIIGIRGPILQAFSNDPEVVRIAKISLTANALSFFLYGYQAIAIVYLLVVKKNTAGFIFSIARQGIVFIPLIYFLNYLFNLNSIIYIQPAADILSAILLIGYMFFLKTSKQKGAAS
ncbi:MAG TPA: MATE family efflux transporter [Erysipelothrix sp.]